MMEHLAANNVNADLTPAVLGATLSIDPAKESFIGSGARAANTLLKPRYRAPYAVPQLA